MLAILRQQVGLMRHRWESGSLSSMDLPAPHSAPEPSMRGPFSASLLLHGGLALTLAAGVALTTTVVRTQEADFLKEVTKHEQAEKKAAEHEAATAALEAAKTQVALSVTDLVAGHVSAPDSDQIIADAQSAVEDLFEQQSEQTGGMDGEMEADLMEQAERVALEKALASTNELLKQALVAQVQAHVKNDVVPEIGERVDRELKQQLGEELKNRIEQAVRDDKHERLTALAKKIREGAEALRVAANATDLRAQREASAAAEEKINPVLTQAAAQDPTLDVKQQALISDRSLADTLAKSADSSAANKAIAKRAEALESLAQALDAHAGRNEFDAVQQRIAAKSRATLAAPLALAVRARIEAQTVPMAAEKITAAVAKDLEIMGLPKDAFQEAVAGNIRKTLAAAAAADPLAGEVAWMKADRALGFRQTSDLVASREAVGKATDAIEQLVKEQSVAAADNPTAQRALAVKISQAENTAREALGVARAASLQADDRIEQSLDHLRKSPAAAHAQRAADAMDKHLAEPAKKEMGEAAQHLNELAKRMQGVDEALAHEAATRPSPPPASASELAAQADAPGTATSAAAVSHRVGQEVTIAAHRAVDRAAEGLKDSGVLERTDKVGQLMDLRAKLGEALQQSTDPRAMGATQIAAGLGAGLVSSLPSRGGDARTQGLTKRRAHGFNRDLYEKFVKDLRERTNPSTAQTAPPVPAGLDTTAEPSDIPEPAVVYVPKTEAETEATADGRSAEAGDAGKADKPAKPQPAVREPAKPTFPSPAYSYAPFQAIPLKIDGDLADWGATSYPITMRWTTDNQEISDGPTAWIRWSNEGVYLAYTIQDPTGIQRTDIPWSGDCAEFWLDTDNARKKRMKETPSAQQLCFIPFGTATDPALTFCEIARGFRGTQHGQRVFDTDHTRGMAAAKEIAGGYQVEAFVRKQALAKPVLLPGMWVAVNISLNSGVQGQSGREVQWSASKSIETWDRPDTWGDVQLLGADAAIRILSRIKESEPAPLAHLVVGQSFTVEVTDADLNIDAKHEDRVAITVEVPKRNEPVLAVLKETGPDTGIFRCSLATRSTEDDPDSNVVRVRPGDIINASYQDVRAACGETDRVVIAQLPVAIPVMRFGAQ